MRAGDKLSVVYVCMLNKNGMRTLSLIRTWACLNVISSSNISLLAILHMETALTTSIRYK